MLRQPRRRRAFTLLELLLVMVVFGIVAGATVQIIVRQQRFYASMSDITSMRGSLRDAMGVLPIDLREISSAGGDIYAMSDSAIDFRASVGIAVACSIPTSTTIIIPPTTLVSRSGVTTWIAAPATGDTAFVYNDGTSPATIDDSWFKVALTAAPATGVCPTSSSFTSSATEAAASYTLTVSPALPSTVIPGSLIRFYRRAKYKLFQPTAGGAWYLGYMDCPGGVCGTLQAVAGPFVAYSATASATGLRFVYRDTTGAVTTDRTKVARIDITARAQTDNIIRMSGRPADYYADSLVLSVALRNRS